MKRLLLLLFIAAATLNAAAQKNAAYVAYIDSYKNTAIDQMRRYNIPACITLAQAILESGAGQSYLATTANNHFGIKTGNTWTGPWVTKDDDKAQEKFRKYNSAAESYEDHSRFLLKQRYSGLFQLEPTDYRGWAHGLKAAGYATNPQYALLLIDLIEKYDLTQYDRQGNTSIVTINDVPMYYDDGIISYVTADYSTESHSTQHGSFYQTTTHTPRICNDVVYIRANKGDSYESLAYEFETTARRLRQYNEVPAYYEPQIGEIVYLAKKKSHVAPRLRGAFHKVNSGESMYSISQCYGIKMRCLYRWNGLPNNFRATVGDLLLVK